MKIKLSTLRVGDTISVDLGYNGMISMEAVTVVSISTAADLWDAAKTEPYVEVRESDGRVIGLRSDLFE